MKNLLKTNVNRRQLFTGVLRYATLGLITVSSAVLIAKRRRLTINHKCVNKGICSGCGQFDQCGLPQALSAKRVSGNTDVRG